MVRSVDFFFALFVAEVCPNFFPNLVLPNLFSFLLTFQLLSKLMWYQVKAWSSGKADANFANIYGQLFSIYVFLNFDFILFGARKLAEKLWKNDGEFEYQTSPNLSARVPPRWKKEKLAYHRLKNFSLTRILRTPWDFRLATADFWHYNTQLLRSDLIYINFYQYDQIS